MAKATLEDLSELHGAVAKALKNNIEDPKILAIAIQFLKNNSVTVEELPTKYAETLFGRVEALKTKPSAVNAVEDILKEYAN